MAPAGGLARRVNTLESAVPSGAERVHLASALRVLPTDPQWRAGWVHVAVCAAADGSEVGYRIDVDQLRTCRLPRAARRRQPRSVQLGVLGPGAVVGVEDAVSEHERWLSAHSSAAH